MSAAVQLLEREGAEAFSVRRLAAELGVDTMALYKHVQSKDDLLGAALAHAFQNARPIGGRAWWEEAGATFREHRRVIRAQPWILTVMLRSRLSSSEPWAGVEETLELLQKHLGAAGAARWMRLLAAFTNGFLLSEPELVAAPSSPQLGQKHPRVAAALSRNARTSNRDFESGLDVLITAMRDEAATRSRDRAT